MAAPGNEFARDGCDLLSSVGPCVAKRMNDYSAPELHSATLVLDRFGD